MEMYPWGGLTDRSTVACLPACVSSRAFRELRVNLGQGRPLRVESNAPFPVLIRPTLPSLPDMPLRHSGRDRPVIG